MANDETARNDSAQSLYEEISGNTFDPATAYDDPNAEAVVPEGWTTGPIDDDLPAEPEEFDPSDFVEVENLPVDAPQADAPKADKVEAPAEPEPQPEPATEPVTEDRTETVLDPKQISALKQRLRSEAEREVINNHRDEYVAIAQEKFAEHGLEFTRRLTDEERAEQQIKELLEKNPALAAKFGK